MNKFIVGLTGGIASGKTAVSDMLKEKGLPVIDADIISREITADGGKAEDKLKNAFPFAYVNGKLDRKILREEVFANPDQLERLNAITHPLIRAEINQKIAQTPEKVVILVVPLLFETGYDRDCDYIVTVVADEKTRINRIKNRNNSITDKVARSMIESQLTDEIKIKGANEVIYNDGDLNELKIKVDELFARIEKLANSCPNA